MYGTVSEIVPFFIRCCKRTCWLLEELEERLLEILRELEVLEQLMIDEEELEEDEDENELEELLRCVAGCHQRLLRTPEAPCTGTLSSFCALLVRMHIPQMPTLAVQLRMAAQDLGNGQAS